MWMNSDNELELLAKYLANVCMTTQEYVKIAFFAGIVGLFVTAFIMLYSLEYGCLSLVLFSFFCGIMFGKYRANIKTIRFLLGRNYWALIPPDIMYDVYPEKEDLYGGPSVSERLRGFFELAKP